MKLYRSKGQHILKNRNIARRIVEYAEVCDRDTVLEVGCGTGVLTSELLLCAGKVVGIEIDSRFVELLCRKFENEIKTGKLELLRGDALKINFPEFSKFVSNIPYSISSPLTFRLLEYGFERAVIMYQKEFAERLIARSGKNYGRISVVVRAYAKPRIVEYVSRRNFIPPPKVDSAVVVFEPEPEIETDVTSLKAVVKACFSVRRKKLAKTLRQFDLPDWIIRKYGDRRAEELTPEDYALIADVLHGQ